jgi:hypothetical protein
VQSNIRKGSLMFCIVNILKQLHSLVHSVQLEPKLILQERWIISLHSIGIYFNA